MADEDGEKWKSFATLLSALTEICDGECLAWLLNDVKPAVQRDTSIVSSDNAFKLEIEESLEPLLDLSADLADEARDAVFQQSCHLTRKFLKTSGVKLKGQSKASAAKPSGGKGGKGKGAAKGGAKDKGGASKSGGASKNGGASKSGSDNKSKTSEVFVSDTDACLRMANWLNGNNPNGIVCHEMSPSFFAQLKGKGESEDEEAAIEKILMHEASRKLWQTENAGGTSQLSEGVSMEVLFGVVPAVKLLQAEMEIEYSSEASSKTDYSVEAGMQALPIGVSVTRAMEFQSEFDEEDARILLTKKLEGIVESSNLVASTSRWEKQILHVLTASEKEATALVSVYFTLPEEIQGDTLVLITACPPLTKTTSKLVQNLTNRIFYSPASEKIRTHKVSVGKVKAVFVKELAALHKCKVADVGQVEFSLPDSVLACSHTIVGEKIGGPECMVCGYATEKRVYKCSSGCGLLLCGSCQWKWKERL